MGIGWGGLLKVFGNRDIRPRFIQMIPYRRLIAYYFDYNGIKQEFSSPQNHEHQGPE